MEAFEKFLTQTRAQSSSALNQEPLIRHYLQIQKNTKMEALQREEDSFDKQAETFTASQQTEQAQVATSAARKKEKEKTQLEGTWRKHQGHLTIIDNEGNYLRVSLN